MKTKISFFILLFSSIIFSQWELVNKPEGFLMQPAYDAVDSLIVLTAFKDESILRVSKNYGKTWQEYTQPGFTCLTVNKSYKIWGCRGNGDIYYSDDYGNSWIKQYDDEKDTFLNYIKFFDDLNGVCVGDSPDSATAVLVLKTDDGGKTWKSVNDSMGIGDVSYGTYYPICFPSKDVGFFDIAKADQLNKTTDGGKTWTDTNFPDKSVRIMDFYDENIGYTISSDYINQNYVQIYKTEDGGVNWQKKTSLNFNWPMSLEIVPSNHSQIWFTDFDNLYYSGDNGQTSGVVDLGTHSKNPPQFIKFVSDKIGYVITDSAHVYITYNNGGNSPTSVEKIEDVPNSFVLHQNYPNPFNPSTKISFQLSKEGFANLSVYDVLGNKVQNLQSGNLESGNYTFNFHRENLSSGVYIIKLTFEGFSQTKKMLLVK